VGPGVTGAAVTRPWGHFTVLLDGQHCKVKTLQVNPGHSISYQYHHKRKEDWTIVEGDGVVTLDGIDIAVTAGDHVSILPTQKHTVLCSTSAGCPLIIVEVQTGEYFGEDDIVRLSDRYGRA